MAIRRVASLAVARVLAWQWQFEELPAWLWQELWLGCGNSKSCRLGCGKSCGFAVAIRRVLILQDRKEAWKLHLPSKFNRNFIDFTIKFHRNYTDFSKKNCFVLKEVFLCPQHRAPTNPGTNKSISSYFNLGAKNNGGGNGQLLLLPPRLW